jgi:hypothetical protein
MPFNTDVQIAPEDKILPMVKAENDMDIKEDGVILSMLL